MGMIVMAGQASPAPASGGSPAWMDKVQRHWGGTFEDEQQQAIWNKASTSALYLTTLAIFLANLVFITADYSRYASCSVVFFFIGLGGLWYAQAVARRQNVRPIPRVPSWLATGMSSALFGGILFVVVTRGLDSGGGWQSRAVTCAVTAVVWGVLSRVILKRRHDRMVRAEIQAPAGR
jgi:hypothetical protein